MTDRILSMWQPWASALFIPSLKTIETRSFKTGYRGRLWIHAAKKFPPEAQRFATEEHQAGRLPATLSFGVVLGSVDLVDVSPTQDIRDHMPELELRYGDYSDGRYAWVLRNPQLLPEPIPFKGAQGLRKCVPFLEVAA